MPRKAFKLRLYPTKKQREKLEWTLTRCCELYNASLQERIEAWKYARESMNFAAQCRSLTVIRNEIRPQYQEIGSHVLQNVLHRVDNAFKDFFRRVKRGEKPGYPRYQSIRRYDSFCFPDAAGWKLKNNRLQITNIGEIKVTLHRKLQGKVKTTTIKREGECWYVVFVCEVETMPRTPYTDEAVGIDLGVSKLATLSTGDVIENPRHYRKAEKKLEKAQQAFSRKKRGSNRRKKAVKVVAKLHRKVPRDAHQCVYLSSLLEEGAAGSSSILASLRPDGCAEMPVPARSVEQAIPRAATLDWGGKTGRARASGRWERSSMHSPARSRHPASTHPSQGRDRPRDWLTGPPRDATPRAKKRHKPPACQGGVNRAHTHIVSP